MTSLADENLEPNIEKEEIKEVKASLITVDNKSQQMIAKDNSELYRIIQVMMKGNAFPKTLDTPEKSIAAWQMAASMNIPPAIAIQNMAVIHGSVMIYGQLPKALAERTGELEDFKLIKFNKEQELICLANKNLDHEVWGVVVQIKRKGRSLNEYSFTLLDAEKAGLRGKSGPWRDYTSIMMSRRAAAQAIKFEFPDALMGIQIAEYDANEAPDIKDVSSISEKKISSLSEKLKSDQSDQKENI